MCTCGNPPRPTWFSIERKVFSVYLAASVLVGMVGSIGLLCCRYNQPVCPSGCVLRASVCYTEASAISMVRCDDPTAMPCSDYNTYVLVAVIGAFLTLSGVLALVGSVVSERCIRNQTAVHPLGSISTSVPVRPLGSVSAAVSAYAISDGTNAAAAAAPADADSLQHSAVSVAE